MKLLDWMPLTALPIAAFHFFKIPFDARLRIERDLMDALNPRPFAPTPSLCTLQPYMPA